MSCRVLAKIMAGESLNRRRSDHAMRTPWGVALVERALKSVDSRPYLRLTPNFVEGIALTLLPQGDVPSATETFFGDPVRVGRATFSEPLSRPHALPGNSQQTSVQLHKTSMKGDCSKRSANFTSELFRTRKGRVLLTAVFNTQWLPATPLASMQ